MSTSQLVGCRRGLAAEVCLAAPMRVCGDLRVCTNTVRVRRHRVAGTDTRCVRVLHHTIHQLLDNLSSLGSTYPQYIGSLGGLALSALSDISLPGQCYEQIRAGRYTTISTASPPLALNRDAGRVRMNVCILQLPWRRQPVARSTRKNDETCKGLPARRAS